jgi:hypothetical protein
MGKSGLEEKKFVKKPEETVLVTLSLESALLVYDLFKMQCKIIRIT